LRLFLKAETLIKEACIIIPYDENINATMAICIKDTIEKSGTYPLASPCRRHP